MKLKLLHPVGFKYPISSPFGKERELTIDGETVKRIHNGIDFAVPIGTPIMACRDGVVHRSGWENPSAPKQGYGMLIMQRVAYGDAMYYLFYAHCNELLVGEGTFVREGQQIAKSGNTGRSSGPHLHLGARKHDTGQYFDMEFYGLGSLNGVS